MLSPDNDKNLNDVEDSLNKDIHTDNSAEIDFGKNLDDIKIENKNNKRKYCKKFPTAYVILLGFEIFAYILTFIIQKGKFQTLEYSKEKFIRKYQNGTTTTLPGTQEVLDELKIKIPLQNFIDGLITKAVPIPDTYEEIEGENVSFFALFINPVKGVINSMNISLFIMIISGDINILVQTKAMECGIRALIKCTKGKEFLLLCLAYIFFSICGTTIGMIEQSFCFYQILMPVYLESGIDGMVGAFSIYPGTMIGSMFSLCMPASVVLASYLAGIHFTDGLVFRLISLIIGTIITIGYFYFYHRKVKLNPDKSLVYDMKDKLIDKFINKVEEGEEKKELKDKNIKNTSINDDDNNGDNFKEENEYLLSGTQPEKEIIKFTWTRIVSLILFILGFIMLIIGVSVFGWYFEQMSALFFGISILLMLLSGESQEKAISIFTKGAGDIVSVCLIIGICRGIYFTLEDGSINDSMLYGLSKLFGGVAKKSFALIMIFVFLILGFFIPSSSGLATLSIPIFSPLADVVNVKRYLVINSFMFSQRLVGLISPTSLVLIACNCLGYHLIVGSNLLGLYV